MKDKFADKLYDYYRLKEDNYRRYKILSSNHVIDENQSVKWNKDEVEKRNKQCREDLIKSQKEVAEVYQQLLNEIFDYYKEEYPEILKSFAQFNYLWERANDESLTYGYHSVMVDFEDRLEDFEEFRKLGEV